MSEPSDKRKEEKLFYSMPKLYAISFLPGHCLLYKCKRCRRTLATSRNLLPHVKGEAPDWRDPKWSLPAEEVLEGAADLGLDLCHPRSVFVCPVAWMRAEVRQTLAGRLKCPNCQAHVGAYSWVAGADCGGCQVQDSTNGFF